MLNLLDPRTSRVLATLLLFTAVLGFIYVARQTLLLFLFAIFFAYLIDPVVDWGSRLFKGSRGKAIAVVYVAMALALAVFFLFLGPHLVNEGQKLAQTVPGLYQNISSGQIAVQVGSQHGWSWETQTRIKELLAGNRDTIDQWARALGLRLADVGKNAWLTLLIPILAVFFLRDSHLFKATILEMFELRRQRSFVEGVLADVHLMLAHYIRAQLILAALTGVVFTPGLSLLRVPYGYVLGVIAGFLEFIPMLGPLTAALLIIGVAIGTGYRYVLVLLLFLGVWRLVQDYVISPRIMRKQVQLHPLLVLFAILTGAEIGGIVGVYLSIPLIASLRILWNRWRAYRQLPMHTPAGDVAPMPAAGERVP